MNRLRCFLSGGHRYNLSRIVTTREPRSRTITLCNFCAKCGKMISFDIPDAFIDMEIKKFKENEWSKRWSGDGT